jgi:DNA topoisomerase I
MATGLAAIDVSGLPDLALDPVESARMAGLRYITDETPGIRRKRAGKHFRYVGPDGEPIRDEKTLQRIKSLAIPPAWTDVWISPRPNGHIQATGRDARGRKQYRYHPEWRAFRDETKFHRMLLFGQALPHIRDRVNQDLGLRGLPREKVLATVVRLLEETYIRVGNEEYARENRSYGLTTLRNHHVAVDGTELRFHFTGKSGVRHRIRVRDRRVAAVIRRLQDLPGHHLFEYVDDDGEIRMVTSDDVNEYLREISGEDFTAKDFRTWAGTVLAATALEEFETFDSNVQAKKNVVQAIERVAKHLGNTPTVCRKCYVHPEVLNAYLEGSTIRTFREQLERELREELSDLDPEEAAVMALLRERLARDESRLAG